MPGLLMRRDPFEAPDWTMINRFFDEPVGLDWPKELRETMMPVDVSEDDKFVIVRASMPGFKRNEVQLEVRDDTLMITAEHTEETETKKEKFYRKERRFGTLNRQIPLPTRVSESDAEALLDAGVLTIRMPKRKDSTTRKITVK